MAVEPTSQGTRHGLDKALLRQSVAALQARLGLIHDHNQGVLTLSAFTAAQAALRNEVIDDPDFAVLGLEFDDILDGIQLIRSHNLNSSDGAILQAYLRYASPMRASVISVLVASDHRLLRAAKAEGLEVLNPESVQAAQIPAYLAAL